MKYEVLKRSHLKRNILIAVLVVALISSLILNFTQAKYRVTESMPLIQGTINFSPSDLNLMAVYLNKNGETISSDKVPHVGYTLNTEQSICEVNDVEDETIEIVYENGLLNFNGLGNKGTKCTAYFDLIPDSENPVINAINSTSADDTSITITVDATDNIGIYYYYYKLDNEEEIRIEKNNYTFEGLEKDSVHTITVRVEDAVGNVSESQSKEVTVGYRVGDVILVASPTQGKTTDWTGGTSYYYTGNPNNWVQFAGFYWRIIRINGDGSIRMIYQGTAANETGIGTQIGRKAFNSSYNNNMYVGFKYGSDSSDYATTHANINNSTILGADDSDDTRTLNGWYRANLLEYANYIDGNAGFCGDRTPSTIENSSNGLGGTGTTTTYYGAYIRLYNKGTSNSNPSLQCDSRDIYTTTDSSNGNKSLQYPIGLVTADEAALTGITWNNANTGSYLYTGQTYWTMSPSFSSYVGPNIFYAFVFYVYSSGNFDSSWGVDDAYGVRPVINIKADVQLTGSGTTTDPFKVVGAS